MKYIRKIGKHFATESGVKMGMRYKKCTKIKNLEKLEKIGEKIFTSSKGSKCHVIAGN